MTHNDDRTPAFTFLRAGLACEIAGDRATAVEFYRRMKEPDERDRLWDTPNYRRGQELLKHPITPAEVLITMAANESVQNHPDSALALYRKGFEKAGANPDLQARALYGILQVSFDRDSLASALETGQKLVPLNPVNETWVLPHTWFKLGQTYARLGKTAEARAALKKVEDYDDYDYQERLERQAKKELDKLDQAN
jgi:tetratricopeptide (TPR) repeat protein